MSREFKYLVRIHGTNLDGTKKIAYALCGIKGVGERLAHTVVKALGLDPDMRLGILSDSDIKSLGDAVENPASVGVPTWMFNRRRDLKTGEDIHLIASNLITQQRNDIELMKELGSWKGRRHSLGLKVRGQRTKTTARRGRVIGVSRRRVKREQRERS